MTRLALRNGVTDDGRSIDLTVEDGVIADLSPAADSPAVDLGGRLLIPGLVDAHVHLDKTLLGRGWTPHAPGDDVKTRVAAEKRLRLSEDWDVGLQGDLLLQRLVEAGSTAIRTHVDIDETVRLENLHALLALRARWADRVTLQIVAFPQSGILRCPGMPDLLDAALREGADLVGGLDPLGFDGDEDLHLNAVFALAERRGKPIDIHLHDGGQAGLRALCAIAARTRAAGLPGKVSVSHAFALGEAAHDDFLATAEALARAGVSIVTSVPGDRPIPPIAKLAEAGVVLALGSDNIRDAWSPMSVVSMTERAMLAAYRSGYRLDAQLRACLDLSLVGGARVLGLAPGRIAPGARADLIALDAPNIPAAVVERPRPDLVLHAGRIVIDKLGLTKGSNHAHA